MSVHFCDRCGDVCVDAELCRCAAAAARLSPAGHLAEAIVLLRDDASPGAAGPEQPAPARPAPVGTAPPRAA